MRYGNSIGTGFTIEKNGKQYLISAKHVFANLTEPDTISIFNDGNWKELQVKPIFFKNNTIDIIAFDFGDKNITPRHEILLGVGESLSDKMHSF